MTYYIAQIFGIIGLLVMVIGLFQKKREKMLYYFMLNGVFFGVEYLLLRAYSGMLSNIFGIFRTICSNKKEKDERLNKWYVLAFFMIGYLIIGIITFDGKGISFLPIVAELIYVLSLWQNRVKKIKIGTLIMVVLWLIYDIIVKAYPSAITDVIVFTSTLLSLITNEIIPYFKKRGLYHAN